MTTKIYARNTVLQKITTDVASAFVGEYHRQGMPHSFSSPFCYGLFHQDVLVGVAVFSNPRTAAMRKKYHHELLRMCFKEDQRIVGGASKLVKGFITDCDPVNFFTYQDTAGESTDVYAHCGMTLVKSAKRKKVLVINGKTFPEAENNRQDWFSMEQVVRFGPDRLVKSSLGNVRKDDGTQYTNVDLFTEFLGYHVEEIPGDNLFEWVNPNPPAEDPSPENKETKHTFEKRLCETHREPLTKNGVCLSCVRESRDRFTDRRDCPTHGVTTFYGDKCLKCSVDKSFTTGNCVIHGIDATLKNGKCVACINTASIEYLTCEAHGTVPYVNGKCFLCARKSNPMVRSVADYHGVRDQDGKLFLTCPDCGHQWGTKQHRVLDYSFQGVSACVKCREGAFWDSTEALTVAASFLSDDDKDKYRGETNMKNVPSLAFTCPHCGAVKRKSVRTFVSAFHRGKPLCGKCKMSREDLLSVVE